MIKKLFEETCGLYEPAFFHIEISEKFDFNCWDNNREHQKAILLHEYIHYLQDISTGYGYRNFISIVKELQAYIYKASIQDTIVKIPINISDIENADLDSLLGEIYQGDSDFCIAYLITNVKLRENEFLQDMDKGIAQNIPEVVICTENGEYRFGGMCVMESMAQLIESVVYPKERMSYCFPYNSCEMLCQYIYPELLERPQNLIALCDAVLMSIQPGLTFYDILVKMKADQFKPRVIQDVYDYVFAFPKKWIYAQQFEETIQLIDEIYNPLALNTKELNLWLKNKISLAYKKRTDINDRIFISKIALYEHQKDAEEYFLNLMVHFGMPLITNEENIYVSNKSQQDIGLVLLFGPLALRKIFSGISKDNVCEMYKYCRAQKITKDICKTAPWEIVSNEKLCPLGQFWYSFGLENKIIQKNEK